MTDLHAPWNFVLGNADHPMHGEIRDNQGHLIMVRATVNDDDENLMRCIAAAPAMLEALKLASRQLAKTAPKKFNFDHSLAFATITKAIAMAEGNA